MFEPVTGPLSLSFVPHHLGKPQCGENIAHPRHATANRRGDLAWAHFFVLCQQLNNCEGYGVPQEPAEA